MKKFNINSGAIGGGNKAQGQQVLSGPTRPANVANKEIIPASDPVALGELFDMSFNARVGVLSKDPTELDRLIKVAETLSITIPKEKLPYVSFIILDNKMDLRSEILAPPSQLKNDLTEDQIKDIRRSALITMTQAIQKGCTLYAHKKNPSWNQDELKNELSKLKDVILRIGMNDHSEPKVKQKLTAPLLFTKKKGVEIKDNENEHQEHLKLQITAPRTRQESIPSNIATKVDPKASSYSFLDLLADDGYDMKDLEHFEEQVILKLDKLKEHVLNQFNPVFNELNSIKKKLRILSEQTANMPPKSIMK